MGHLSLRLIANERFFLITDGIMKVKSALSLLKKDATQTHPKTKYFPRDKCCIHEPTINQSLGGFDNPCRQYVHICICIWIFRREATTTCRSIYLERKKIIF